jgi:starch synthase (maltosyl-transferring)
VLGRLIIDDVRPRTPGGHPAKALVGDRVVVSADIYREGHDLLAARVRWRPAGGSWAVAPLVLDVNDRWEGSIDPTELGSHELQVEAWTDRFATWRHDVELKAGADPDDTLATEIEEGALLIERLAKRAPKDARPTLAAAVTGLRDTTRTRDERLNAGLDDHVAALLAGVVDDIDLTRSPKQPLWVDRERAGYGAWYELFPRSEGGFAGAAKRLPAIASMGFDVVYLPPVHPIGTTARKGRNNTLVAGPDDVGSPWAIGNVDGGHTELHAELGDIGAFDDFVDEAASNGLEVALDYALQCSPDHPWVREHPEWFHHRPDGTIKYAENPPKKYQDIYPINFWPDRDADRKALWNACKEILDHWIAHDIKIFRVDNPHTKPFAFWEWLIPAVLAEHPDVVFLAEAFTRPKMMAKLAEIGFSQSYTYFTWRTARWELVEYLTELSTAPLVDYMRPSFWPNTPDILAGPLRDGPPSAFRLRFLLAATATPTYGMYSGYELCENEPASSTNEEYLHSEKYEIREREWDQPGSLAPFITLVNEARRRHPAFKQLRTLCIHDASDESIIVWSKTDPATGDAVLCVVNLDPFGWHEATLSLDLPALGLDWEETYDVVDELTGATYAWTGAHPYVRLDPAEQPGHVFAIRPRS